MCFVDDVRYSGQKCVGGKVVDIDGNNVHVHMFYGAKTTVWKPHTISAPHLGKGRKEARIEIFPLDSIYHHSFDLLPSGKLAQVEKDVLSNHSAQ